MHFGKTVAEDDCVAMVTDAEIMGTMQIASTHNQIIHNEMWIVKKWRFLETRKRFVGK